MSKFIERPGAWIIRALGLRPGDAPQTLADEAVPVVDLVQGGAARAVWTFHRVDVTNPVSAVIHDVLQTDEYHVGIAWAGIGRAGGAAANATDVFYALRPEPYSVNAALRLWDAKAGTLAAAFDVDWRTIGGGQRFWLVPPQTRLTISLPAGDGVTDRWVHNAWTALMPVGAKFW